MTDSKAKAASAGLEQPPPPYEILPGQTTRQPDVFAGPSFSRAVYPAFNDPFSEEAIQRADARAKGRFFSALFYALSIWIVMGIVCGGGIYEEVQLQASGRHFHWQASA